LDSTTGHAVVLFVQKDKDAAFSGISVEVADTSGKVLETLLEVDKEAKGPTNVMLQSKIAVSAPFDLVLTFQLEGKSKKVSRRINSMDSGVQGLGKEAGFIERAYFEVQ
jgi:hypothetical protein